MEWRTDGSAVMLKFAPEIEQRFDADTRVERSRELRLTIAFGIGFYLLTGVTDFVLVPDVGASARGIKALVAALIVIPVLFVSRLPPRVSELISTFVPILAITSLPTFQHTSSSTLTPT